jgi:hypothetical protein
MIHAMANRVRTQAAKEGHRVSIKFVDDSLVVTMKSKNGTH